MDDKTWTVVGVSTKQGATKMRFANGTAEARKRVLQNDGHIGIDLRDLPKPMTKDEATRWWHEQGGQTALSLDAPKAVAPQPEKQAISVQEVLLEPEGDEPWLPPGTPKGQTWYDAPMPPAHMIKAWGPNGPINPPHPRSYWPWKNSP